MVAHQQEVDGYAIDKWELTDEHQVLQDARGRDPLFLSFFRFSRLQGLAQAVDRSL
jgi:hypothetical protein